MVDIFTADVRATVDIEGTELSPTHVETSLITGPTAGTAKIEGYSDDPSSLELDQIVKVYMGTNDETGRTVQNKVFDGQVKKVTQNEEGLLTIEAYNELVNLHGKSVRYTNEEPLPAYEVLTDVLSDAGYIPATSYSFASSGGDFKAAHIVPPGDIPGDVTVGKQAYGSGLRGEPLTNVLADLATKLGCVMWVDTNNVIRILPYPEHRSYEVKYIIELNGGDNAVNHNKVLVQGSTPSGDIGPAASNIYSQKRTQSDAQSGSGDEKEFRYQDNNIITQEEANRVAASNQFSRQMAKNAGEVTVVGNPEPRLFDVVSIPALRQQESYDTTADDQQTEQFDDTVYGVTGITHVVDSENGYETTLELGPEPGESAASINGVAGALANELTDRIESNRQDPGSPLNFLPGFE